ncbi:DEAD/DEAH box helicase [Atopomonas sediminilitoris]|uniref:DEAD/DEAH box helicase n=1 Tax=Atopomonas sediminilitoris TaxID=2919919 RepID=UPI001F4DEAC7|nr:DEAD/DEAH box helicase [Atopomonas sediminilitoris]MCJ8170177.1 DEAD/DEAH box helicase [Atopomonas sediminilitoris]
MTFSEFGLSERLHKAIEALKFTTPTEVQQQAIPPALAGKDLCVTAQTGSGKTAAFLLPMLERLQADEQPQTAPRALILLPTRELAQQTLREFSRFARFTFLKAELITGGEGFKEQAAYLRKNPDVVIGTPGRLLEHLEAGNLPLDNIQVLVLDEADRMLDMGFADDVLKLVSPCSAARQSLLFSATTGGAAMGRVIDQVLREPQFLRLHTVRELNPEVIQQIVTSDDVAHKERQLQWLLAHEKFNKAMIFTNTRAQADRLGGVLRACKHTVYVLHGEKPHDERKLIMARFKRGEFNVLVATDVAARGLDVAELDLVINFDMAQSGDEYVHRIGRTGRAGASGLVISLICPNDWNLMSSIERYLKLRFVKRPIKELGGSYQGPKKLKASGKAASGKKKKKDKDGTKAGAKTGKKPAAKKSGPGKSRPARNDVPATVGSSDGFAPPRRKPKAE